MSRTREITPELRDRMSALLAEGMPFTEVASVVGRSPTFVRKYCPGQSHWDCVAAARWAAVAKAAARAVR